jgi:monofunctional biosynthetic peptidoglycan transglycosylase
MPQDPESAAGVLENGPASDHGPWWRRAIGWVRSHKILTALALILLWVLLEAATIPWFAVAELRKENPGETALMRQRRDEAAEEGRTLHIVQEWVSVKQLPRHFLDAVIVAEDGTFYRHGGIEWFEVWESFRRNLREGRVARGASSITQQVAKNLYLSTDQTPVRKLKELVITLLLEGELTKDRILELYVNVIEWGPGIFGVQAAAREYFNTRASSLSLEESIRLAAVIPSPLKHRPDRESRYLRFQTRVIRERMRARGMLPAPEEVAPVELPPALTPPDPADAEKDTTDAL